LRNWLKFKKLDRLEARNRCFGGFPQRYQWHESPLNTNLLKNGRAVLKSGIVYSLSDKGLTEFL